MTKQPAEKSPAEGRPGNKKGIKKRQKKSAVSQTPEAEHTREQVTDRKEAEEHIRESEETYRTLAERVHDGIYMCQGSRFIYVNSRMAEIAGYSTGELTGSEFMRLVHPDDQILVADIARKRSRGEPIPDTHEIHIVRKDGTVRSLEIAMSSISFRGEQVVLGAVRDITQRKYAEMELRESEEKYRNLYLNAVIGIFHSTFGGRFTDVNPALATMLGYASPEEAVRSITSIADQVYPDPVRYNAVSAEALKRGEIVGLENRYRRRDGSLWWGMLHLRIVPARHGQPSLYEGFVEDITERKRAEQELIESEQRYRNIITNSQTG